MQQDTLFINLPIKYIETQHVLSNCNNDTETKLLRTSAFRYYNDLSTVWYHRYSAVPCSKCRCKCDSGVDGKDRRNVVLWIVTFCVVVACVMSLCECVPLLLCLWVLSRHHHHHISVMELGHLLTHSCLTYPEVSSKVCHDSFCQLGNSVWVQSTFMLSKVVHSVHFLDQCTQFHAPTKCTILIICK